jgi:hypothetical protein
MQRQDGDAPGDAGKPLGRAGVDGDALQVLGMELTKLHEEHAAVVAPRCVPRSRRVADVGARGIFAQFVREGALKDQKLLAQCVLVTREAAAGPIADNAGCPRDLVAVALQHPPLDPGHRRGDPPRLVGKADRALGHVGMDQHGPVLLRIRQSAAAKRKQTW